MKLEDTLKKILEGMDVLNAETRTELAKTFKSTLEEAKVEQEKALRAEMVERYATEKKNIHAALEQFLEQEMQGAVADLRSGVEEVDNMKKQYADKTVMVKEQAKAYVAKRLGALEAVIEGILQQELGELHESEKVNRRAYLNAITEAKALSSADREAFRQKAALVLENIVNVQVQGTLDELREDIKAAREADFGRELYETFMTTFRRQFFDSSKEFRAVTAQLKEAKAETNRIRTKATKLVTETRARALAAEGRTKKVEESVVRTRAIAKMLNPLTGKTRERMQHVLEATATDKLANTYRKFMPEMLNDAKRSTTKNRTRKIEETVVELKTGGQQTLKESQAVSQDDDEIIDIQRRAGMND